jgi:hypothetical protein
MSFIINPYQFLSGTPQLLNEQFEAPGATGWISQTTAPYAAWNDQYATSPAPIDGSYSAQIASAGTARVNAYKNFTATGTCYMRFRFYWTAPGSVGNGVLCTLRDAGGNIVTTLGLASSSNIFRVSIVGLASNAVTAPPANTLLYGWLEYEKGTGSNARARAGWSTTAARPSWPASGASGGLVVITQSINPGDAARVMFGNVASLVNYNFVIDDIQIQATPFA